MSRFFIRRPIFATVLALMITLAGGLALLALPIAQYPVITPPTVQVTATYPGADAQVVAQAVGSPIEQEVNGVEDMIYMSSTSSGDGIYALTVTFEVGTDAELATVRVQNRVARAESLLPSEVAALGVSTTKQSPTILLVANLYSPDRTFDELYLSNYASLRVVDELKRVPGVGDVALAGAGTYAMRVWLDPGLMSARGLSTGEVLSALSEQNIQVAAGAIGRAPAPSGQVQQLSVTARGRLADADAFEEIVVASGAEGGLVKLGDLGRVELGARSYDTASRIDGQPTTSLLVYQLPGSNALDVREAVFACLDELGQGFPPGLEWRSAYDTTMFVEAAISEVVTTLFIASLLVFLTILFFLQDLRASMVPAVAIPVSLVGTFTIMSLMGFSLNMLTLFGLVLAIGIVVDDAIVVVENVKRKLSEGAASARAASEEAMDEVGGPIVATTLVLLAVFVPVGFMGGITGELYKQFALTIAVSTVFSSVVALTLSPALAALVLRPEKKGERNWFERQFDRVFDPTTAGYVACVKFLARRVLIALALFVAMGVLAWQGIARLPTSFLPTEDQGVILVSGQLPAGASLERSNELSQRVFDQIREIPGVASSVEIVGLSLLDGGNLPNAFTAFVTLDPWPERTSRATSQDALLGAFYGTFARYPEANIFAFPPPAIQGLGTSGGFSLELQDRGGLGVFELGNAIGALRQGALETPALGSLQATYQPAVPRLFVDVDRERVKAMQLNLGAVFQALQVYLGSAYVNDFDLFGRTFPVYVQAEAQARDEVGDIARLEVRGPEGRLVPLGSVLRIEETVGPQILRRFNLFPSALLTGNASPGFSSGEAMAAAASLVEERLGDGFGYGWSGVSFQEQESTGGIGITLLLAIVFVFLVLAAQYESWSAPVAILLAVPFGLLGASIALILRGMPSDIYVQIGLVLLVALASKNAILIVEFARELRAQGRGKLEAAVEAARLRFRPILMTSLAFVLGNLPLLIASGAGGASRRSVGTTVFGGMLAATFLTALFVPVFAMLTMGRVRQEDKA